MPVTARQDADAGAVIGDVDAHAEPVGLDTDAAAGGRGMFDDVGDRFLDDAVDGEGDAFRKVRGVHLQVDVDTGHGGAFRERGEFGEAGAGPRPVSVRRTPRR